jgi:hypothetical protein
VPDAVRERDVPPALDAVRERDVPPALDAERALA